MERGNLCITRKAGQGALIGESVLVRVVEIKGKGVRLLISAPSAVRILREELAQREAA